jgi:2-polyprenyl-3-methyl-5-hydroxy-6-metoxy-1,4-benzoquinol methylase
VVRYRQSEPLLDQAPVRRPDGAPSILSVSPECACEIGCGHGLVQRQIEDRFGIPVDGIDLNLSSLKASISGKGKLFCYDIFEERPEFRETYDFLILFDVLEHIEDQLGFFTLASNFLPPGGSIAINVPARQELFSAFDVQVAMFVDTRWNRSRRS